MHSSIHSSDAAVQYLVDRQFELAADIEMLGQRLQAYANQVQPRVSQAAVSLQDHYNMLDADACGCVACTEWDERRKEFIRASKLIPRGHKWTVCSCSVCRFVGRFQLNLLAAANRRELLIEMSFHARYHSYHGAVVMEWLQQEMRKPSYTDGWCAQEMSRYPMERWLQRCETAVSGAVGGPVFVTSTMVTDMVVPFSSSLLADVDIGNWLQ